ncbi:hypothetical protein IV68_GL000837 [Weissella halotolerans DSM 20190]|uniref:methylated-DNA--[protein]-cysteine S-methyltransferase n=3 Tax=Weissella halotolerans TaxID=1615 RepID=A0A0R2FVN5_9LACO|nr:hypothetical protein IV68_GL000837 [Weissella halotolerans DSM 20190]
MHEPWVPVFLKGVMMEYERYALSSKVQVYLLGNERGLAFVGSPNTPLTEAEQFLPQLSQLRRANHFQLAASMMRAYWQGKQLDLTQVAHNYLAGTPFQRRVWQAVEMVPYGQTISYQEIALRIGQPKAVRAVATAVAKNPLLLVVPCHRIIQANGQFGNYRAGCQTKHKLLMTEAKAISQHDMIVE